jgi:hypothetical protein
MQTQNLLSKPNYKQLKGTPGKRENLTESLLNKTFLYYLICYFDNTKKSSLPLNF